MTYVASPHLLALSMACGVTGGLFPIPGLTSVPVAIMIYLLGLNPVATMLMNYCCTPLNFATMPVFISCGNQFFGGSSDAFAASALLQGLRDDTLQTMSKFKWILLRAIYIWALLLPVGICLIYAVLFPLLKYSMSKQKPRPMTKPKAN